MATRSSALKARRCIEIKNTSQTLKSVFDGEGVCGPAGRRYDIAGHAILNVEEKLARLFTVMHPRHVVDYVPNTVPLIPGEPVIWLANKTGNPFVPKTVTLTRVTKGEQEDYPAPNPLAGPQVIRGTIPGNQIVVTTADGMDKQTQWTPKTRVELPPHTRMAFSKRYADWIMERDGCQELHHIGKVGVCRAPRADGYEPNTSWSLFDLQVYARSTFPPNVWDGHEDLLGKPGEDYEDDNGRYLAIDTLMGAMFFFLIDEQYDLPDQLGFESHLRAMKLLREQRNEEAKKSEEAEAQAERMAKTKAKRDARAAKTEESGVVPGPAEVSQDMAPSA